MRDVICSILNRILYSIMERIFAKADQLAGHVKDYVETRIRIAKLDAADKISGIVSNLAAIAIVFLVLFCFLLFASIAGAYAFALWFGEIYWGFLAVAGIYLIAGLFIWISRERILRMPILNALLKELFKEENHDEKN